MTRSGGARLRSSGDDAQRSGVGRTASRSHDLRRAGLQPGEPVPLADPIRGRGWDRGPPRPATDRPGERPATGARAAHPHGPPADLLEQPPDRGRVPRREVWPLGHGQVDRLLARHGTHRPSYVRTPVPLRAGGRNELWHIDLKGPFYLLGRAAGPGPATSPPSSTTTAASCSASGPCRPRRRSGSSALLEEAIELCGVPHELMTDNGTPFVAIVRTMLSRFQRRRWAELRIRHIRTQIDTPWTNGKVEAFWATLQSRGARPAAPGRPRCDRGRGHRLCRLPRLPPAPWRARLADTRRTLRWHPVHRPWPRSVPVLGPDRIPAGCHPGRLRCLIFTGATSMRAPRGR